jgi:hypothetical protein
MRFIRQAGAPRVLAAAMTALAMAAAVISAGAPAQGASIRSIRQGCIWEPLSLMNGWQSAQNLWNTGNPAYCVINGAVYLSGSLTQPTAGPSEFAVLPSSALPATRDYLSVYTFQGVAGVLRIDPDGAMSAYLASAAQFTSLAGVSFPAAGTALQPLTPLTNGWQSAQSLYDTGNPAYYTSAGITHLSGSLTGGTPPDQSSPYPIAATYFATLPPGTSSSTACALTSTYAFGGNVAALDIEPDGTMGAYNSANTADSFTTLSGITVPQDGAAWQPLSLLDIWEYSPAICSENGAISNMPSYYVSGNVVYLSGAMGIPDNGPCATTDCTPASEFAILPPAARPTHDLYLLITDDVGGYYSLHIAPSGAMYIFGLTPGTHPWASLDGISYQLTS